MCPFCAFEVVFQVGFEKEVPHLISGLTDQRNAASHQLRKINMAKRKDSTVGAWFQRHTRQRKKKVKSA